MRLADLIKTLPIELESGRPDTRVNDVVEDSRRVGRGSLFVARAGTVTDGRRYIAEAVARGAAAVLTDRTETVHTGGRPVAVLRGDDVAGCAARLAERFHGEPSRRLRLVGVTGTNGKTTVCSLAHQVLGAASVPAGLMGTVGVDVGAGTARRRPAALTTPSAPEASALLAEMVVGGCRACLMEVSSHALVQGRTAGLSFAGAVFTNLTGDHLDYHGTTADYLQAKASLFDALPPGAWAVVNADDPAAATVIERCPGRTLTTSLTNPGADCFASIQNASIDAARARMTGPWGAFTARVPLAGRHNVANALQAAAVCHLLGLDALDLADGLAACDAPPGRLEPVSGDGDAFTVLVDYAHTDDALDAALAALRPLVPAGGRLRVVFGCGGDRDATKRPRMARAAWRWADEVIVTSDNPRTEDPESIIDQIMGGVPSGRRAGTKRLADRAVAIRAAIERSRRGDVVLIAGKGHEDYQIIGRERRSFDDRALARRVLAERSSGPAALADSRDP